MRTFILHLGKNLVGCFSKYYLLWHIGAIVLTYVLVAAGIDWRYFEAVGNPTLQSFFFPAMSIGALLPLVLPALFYATGYLGQNRHTVIAALALVQAEILAFSISAFYKAFTGRIQPPLRNFGMLVDSSNGFHFGFMRDGIFWGWPSTHTTIAFAMAVTLYTLYPTRKFLRYLFLVYAFYIGLGVSINIHWLSDCAAGMIIGTLIGEVVGRSFFKK